jgi:hypothetical protein
MNRLSLLSLFLLFGLYVQAGGQTTGELVGPRYVLDTRDLNPDLKTSSQTGLRFTLDTRELKLDPTTRVVGPRFNLDTRDRPTNLFFSHSKVQENQPVGVEVGKFSVSDAGTFSFSLVAGQGSTGNKNFSLDANGVLKTAQSFDYETVNQFSIRVRVTASGGQFLENTFVVSVIDDPNEDSDGDGFTDAEEKKAGTDPNDPKSNPGLDYGLVAWYPFDGNANDMSGNGNHGTVNGATLGVDRHGAAGKAYDFDGVDDYVQVSSSEELRDLTEYTVSLWASAPNFAENYNPLVTKMSGGISSFEIYGGNGFTLVHNRESTFKSQYYSALHSNRWNHLVITFSGGTLSKYDDGNLDASSTGWSNPEHYDFPIYIGKGTWQTGGARFKPHFHQGFIDDVRIYDRALSTTEVTALYEQEKPNPVQITLSNNSVLENMPMGTVVGKFSGGGAANPEFVLVEGKDSGGNKYFTLSKDGTLRTAVILDYNRTKSLNIRVCNTDGPTCVPPRLTATPFTINVLENAIVPPPPPDPTDYEEKYDEALARLETLRAMDKKADADIAQRRVRLAKLDDELSAADKSLQETNISLAACEKECEVLGADLRAINGAIGVEDAKIYSLNGKIGASEKQFTDLENDKSKLEEDLVEAEHKGSVPHTPGWHFIDGKGWLWTSPDYFPLVYSEQVDGWLYYESGSQAPWLYYEYNTESWQEWSAN